MPDGTRLAVVGPDRQADGRTWRNVRGDGGTAGWMVADALRTIAAPTATPEATATPGPTATRAVTTPTPPASTPGPNATSSRPEASTPGGPPDAEPTPEPERVEVFDAGSTGANLRAEPGRRGSVLRSVPDGSVWTIVGPDRQVDGVNWRNVRGEDGTTGWLAQEVVRTLVTPTPTPRPGAPGIGAPIDEIEAEEELSEEERAATPCRPGQIKGDATSGLYYAPSHPDYAGLRIRVRCFGSESQARASGYRAVESVGNAGRRAGACAVAGRARPRSTGEPGWERGRASGSPLLGDDLVVPRRGVPLPGPPIRVLRWYT